MIEEKEGKEGKDGREGGRGRRKMKKEEKEGYGEGERISKAHRGGNTFYTIILVHCLCRAERESVLALKGLTPSGQLPLGVLSQGKSGLSSGKLEMTVIDIARAHKNGQLE